MSIPIAVQLYSVREQLAHDFEGTLQKIADIGYLGVETYSFGNIIDTGRAQRIFDALDLRVTSSHNKLPLGAERERVLDEISALSTTHLVSAWIPPEHYQTMAGIRRAAGLFNETQALCLDQGLQFSIHNHDFEFGLLEGRPAIQSLRPLLDPGIGFELDTYWIFTAGQDPAPIVRDFGPEAPLLHIKDGSGTKTDPMVALGEGAMDIPAVVKAGGSDTRWLIVELDNCATDMLEALDKSYRYLTNNDLGHGRE